MTKLSLVIIWSTILIGCNAQQREVTAWMKSCTKRDAQMQNVMVDFYPDPPVIGQILTLVVNGTLMEKVTGGQLYVELRFNNLPPLRDTYDLCYGLLMLKVKCPLPPDNLHLQVSRPLPPSLLPGNYSATITAVDQKNSQLFCIKAAIYI
ncbi:putative phosphatidylglycerol/phosphatidylinositol transfer protein DDB_G0282107 [Dysidea avara]|uniref:putative phosphatidylglycerol/phosphatidylinositol transfer protein DDB_G0282107 n=1 Tax=Dysidea avara TaxID=196820 RepID=UPI003318A0E6